MTDGVALSIVPPDPKRHRIQMSELLNSQWERMSSRIRDGHHDWNTSRIGLIEDQVVTIWANFDLMLRIGTARIPTVGVDCVVTHPHHRQKGFMALTARAALDAARTQGYALSLLNSVPDYFERFGYVSAWPQHHYTIETADLPTGRPPFVLEDFSPNHREDLAVLYNRENETHTGTVVRPSYRTFKWPGLYSGYLWKDDAERPLGYLVGDYTPAAAEGACFTCVDAAGDPEEILRLAGLLARQMNYQRVRFERLHHASRLACHLRARGWGMDTRSERSGDFLIAILDLRGVMEHLTDELSLRLSRSPRANWSGELTLRIQEEEITLAIRASEVILQQGRSASHGLAGGADLARLIIGSIEPEELLVEPGVSVWGEGVELARVLFPVQSPQIAAVDL